MCLLSNNVVGIIFAMFAGITSLPVDTEFKIIYIIITQ